MKLKTKLLLAGAFVMLMSILAGAWPLVLVGLAVVAWMGRSRWQSISPEARGGFAKVVELLIAAPINFAAIVAAKRWGIYVIAGVGALMLLDASFGADGIGFPLIGWTLAFLIALVVGGYDWYRRKAPYQEAVEAAVRVAVAVTGPHSLCHSR